MMTRDEFLARLRRIGGENYHHLHPFNIRMHEGVLSPEAIRRWVTNRFYYQRNIPIKDAAILSNTPDREVRRIWLHRIVDHDGREGGEGGIEAWLRLGEACGLERAVLLAGEDVAPGARFAVDAYVNFARVRPWPVAIASSLTEMFAPDIMRERLAAFRAHYQWIPEWGFAYFERRVVQARVDSEEALEITLTRCDTETLQQQALHALKFKCDVLWSLLDAMD